MQIKKPLEGERIMIRDYRREDQPAITGMWFDPVNGQYMIDPTADYVDDWYRTALEEMEDNPEGYYLTVLLRGTDRVIGSCCMFPDETRECWDIGYCVHREFWRRGVGTELVGLLIGWIRAHGGTQITAEVAKDNIGSNRLLRHYGFQVLREASFDKYHMGITFESYIYGLRLDDSSAE